jgi:proteasome lid subunit RPN8/RPN11
MSSLRARRSTDSGTRLVLRSAARLRLVAHALRGYPHEVVGLLLGSEARAEVWAEVWEARPLENEQEQDPARRFVVSGLRLARAEAAAEGEGFDVLGYYHSHPDHPASWSDEDRDQALPGRSYLIASVSGGVGEPTLDALRCWRLAEDRSEMLEERLDPGPEGDQTQSS